MCLFAFAFCLFHFSSAYFGLRLVPLKNKIELFFHQEWNKRKLAFTVEQFKEKKK